MGQDKEKKPIPKWVHFCFWSSVILVVIAALFLLCNQLWILSHQQNWSAEVNAAIINTFIGAITLAVTIGVTVYFNLQTQRITIEQNQKNLELQMELHKQNLEMQERINKQNMDLQQKMQEMNYEAMMFQARASARDYILQKRLEIYNDIDRCVNKVTSYRMRMIESSMFRMDDLQYFEHQKDIWGDYILNNFEALVERISKESDEAWDALLELHRYAGNPYVSEKLRTQIKKFCDWVKEGTIWDEEKLDYILHQSDIIDAKTFYDRTVKLAGRINEMIEKELHLKDIEKDIEELT